MKIKRLQLTGFKSCMDRTVLEFPAGITGIVGPNGCGKSNIVDALRWVLGEQSAKHLRGQVMEDVICVGNQRHGPLGMAEVSLTFDNEGPLPAVGTPEGMDGTEGAEAEVPEIIDAIAGAPEIEVTRRLYRSGESEYLINGRVCRLRDVTELFLGTGVGSKAYSIIEQGRVGEIVGARPEELRLFIEEAAGTTLYRSRKLTAERKIERTRDNLLRLGDIVSELERQAASLKRQVRGAVRYQELKSAEETLDRRLSGWRIRTIEQGVAGVAAKLAELGSREEGLRSECRAAEAERAETRESQKGCEHTAETARVSFYESKASLSRLQQERQHLEDRIGQLQNSLGESSGEGRRIAEQLGLAQAEREEALEKETSIGQELEACGEKKTVCQQELDSLGQRLKDLRAELEDGKSGVVEDMATEASLGNEKESLERQIKVQVAHRQRFDEEAKSLGVVAERLLSEAEQCSQRVGSLCKELEDAANGKEVLAARLSSVLARRAESQRDAETCKGLWATLSSRYQSLKELDDSFAGYGAGVRSFMSNGGRQRTGASAVIADILEVDDGFERAVAAVLQERLQYVVVPDADAGMAGASYLRETEAGRASFIPIAPRGGPSEGANVPPGLTLLGEHVHAHEGYQQVVASLVAGVVVADSLDQATQQWKCNGYVATFVTLEGEVVSPSGVITGGSGEAMDEGLIARRNELRALSVRVSQAGHDKREAEAALTTAGDDADRAGIEIESLDKRLHELTVAKVGAEGALELQRQNLARTEERQTGIKGEIEGLQGELNQHRLGLGLIEDRCGEVRRSGTQRKDSLAQLDVRTRDAGADREAKAAELEALRVSEAELRQKKEAQALRLSTLELLINDLSSRHGLLGRRLARERGEMDKARERLGCVELNPAEVESQAERARIEYEGAEDELKQGRRLLESIERRLEEAGRSLDGVREDKAEKALDLKRYELERNALVEGLRERLGVGLDDAFAAVGEGVDGATEGPQDCERLVVELESVRSRLHRLGTVNIGAVAELEELEGRLAELTGQSEDLERSIESLRGTIARLNRLSKQRFKDTFDAVNGIFQATFTKLFEGGKASLSLTDESNMLETGVEIFCQLPGKRLGNLNLLSGGEKALTAVSLIFSLFLHKPSPFCVLDEVDAPLDDANIGRFAKMVAEMSEHSQFVIITHNKRTMERCGRLYGVTMKDPGISKIVSVDLAEPGPTA
ncbi:MAG: chromosome segregation protein SMC [Deltaproteobacteria bacterium]